MKNGKMAVFAVLAVVAISFAGEAVARGGAGAGGGQGAGIRLQKRDGSCVQNSTSTQTRATQQLQNRSGVNSGTTRQGAGQGTMRKLGPGDGTGNATRPMDGTGYGSPSR
jgi:hypothetical protein